MSHHPAHALCKACPRSFSQPPRVRFSQYSSLIVKGMVFVLASLLVMTLLFQCVFLNFSSYLCRNEVLVSAHVLAIGPSWSVLTKVEDSYPPRQQIFAEKPIHFRVRPHQFIPTPSTTHRVTSERTTTPHYIKDYEMDYPQVYSNVSASTTRVPNKFQRYSYRGMVFAKCEKRDEGKVFSDPTWCRRYFHCLEGFINVRLCPELMTYNPRKKNCDHLKEGYTCLLKKVELDIATWRRVLSNFYMTTERPWVRDMMIHSVVPMDHVTTTTESPYITLPEVRLSKIVLKKESKLRLIFGRTVN